MMLLSRDHKEKKCNFSINISNKQLILVKVYLMILNM